MMTNRNWFSATPSKCYGRPEGTEMFETDIDAESCGFFARNSICECADTQHHLRVILYVYYPLAGTAFNCRRTVCERCRVLVKKSDDLEPKQIINVIEDASIVDLTRVMDGERMHLRMRGGMVVPYMRWAGVTTSGVKLNQVKGKMNREVSVSWGNIKELWVVSLRPVWSILKSGQPSGCHFSILEMCGLY